MSTWNVVTIEKPGRLTLADLPEALTSAGPLGGEDYSDTDEREDTPPTMYRGVLVGAGRPGKPGGNIVIEGRTKYRAEELFAACVEVSASTGGTVTWFEEWDDDEVGQSVTVFRAGELVDSEGRTSELVPVNLTELVESLRDALDHSGIALSVAVRARALVDALRPPAVNS